MFRSLFVREDGRVCCADHVGFYGSSVLSADPDAGYLDTPLGRWVRMSRLDVAEWDEAMSELGRNGCEDCGSL